MNACLDPALPNLLASVRPSRAWPPRWPWAQLSQRPHRVFSPLSEHADDETCMAGYVAGDPRGFELLYRRYRARLHRYALRLAPSAAEAEELFQEVWLALIQGRRQYRAQARFASWLFAIAHRRAADRWRALSRHAPDWRTSVDDEAMPDWPDEGSPGPDRYRQNLDLAAALLGAIDALPLPQREAFLLQAEGELSLQEIAHITDCNRETVKSRLRYASQRLRLALEPWR